jgi:Tol biopolymer transport system component
VAFRNEDGSWGDAHNLGAEVNGPGIEFCASLSPDGKYIFFTKNRDIFWVSSRIIESFK